MKSTTFEITFLLDGNENRIEISEFNEHSAIQWFENNYMHDSIISVTPIEG